ncbi:hypothetical protein AB1N83_013739 [Pleurotus pulmonarius]
MPDRAENIDFPPRRQAQLVPAFPHARHRFPDARLPTSRDIIDLLSATLAMNSPDEGSADQSIPRTESQGDSTLEVVDSNTTIVPVAWLPYLSCLPVTIKLQA